MVRSDICHTQTPAKSLLSHNFWDKESHHCWWSKKCSLWLLSRPIPIPPRGQVYITAADKGSCDVNQSPWLFVLLFRWGCFIPRGGIGLWGNMPCRLRGMPTFPRSHSWLSLPQLVCCMESSSGKKLANMSDVRRQWALITHSPVVWIGIFMLYRLCLL